MKHPSPRGLIEYHSNNVSYNNVINYINNFYTNKYNNNNNNNNKNEHFKLYSFGSIGFDLKSNKLNRTTYSQEKNYKTIII